MDIYVQYTAAKAKKYMTSLLKPKPLLFEVTNVTYEDFSSVVNW